MAWRSVKYSLCASYENIQLKKGKLRLFYGINLFSPTGELLVSRPQNHRCHQQVENLEIGNLSRINLLMNNWTELEQFYFLWVIRIKSTWSLKNWLKFQLSHLCKNTHETFLMFTSFFYFHGMHSTVDCEYDLLHGLQKVHIEHF